MWAEEAPQMTSLSPGVGSPCPGESGRQLSPCDRSCWGHPCSLHSKPWPHEASAAGHRLKRGCESSLSAPTTLSCAYWVHLAFSLLQASGPGALNQGSPSGRPPLKSDISPEREVRSNEKPVKGETKGPFTGPASHTDNNWGTSSLVIKT